MNFTPKLFILSLLIVFTSCRAKEEQVTREKLMSKGFTLMDSGHYDEAIKYFADLASTDPHYQIKIAWASAYAGRAGVKIEQIYSFSKIKDLPPLEISIAGFTPDKKTSELINQLAEYTDHWNRVPTVNVEKLPDLISAVHILTQSTEPGARLYAAALRIVLIKSSINAGTLNWQSQKQICASDIQRFLKWTLAILKELLFLSEDLQIAFPENNQEYENFRALLTNIIKDVGRIELPRGNLCL